MLLLTFAQGNLATGKTYGTAPALTLSVVDGQQVILQRTSGKDFRLDASLGGWSWTQVQQVPRQAVSITVTPKRRGESVSVEVNYSNKDGDETVTYISTVNGDMNQWIPLLKSSVSSQAGGVKRYASIGALEELSVKVERAK